MLCTWGQSVGLSLLAHFWFESDPSPSELIFPSHWMFVRLSSSGKHSVSFFTDIITKNISENISENFKTILRWYPHPSPFSRSFLGSVDKQPRVLLSSILVLPLSRMNLFRPWGPHSFPLAVRALMTLCRSAAFGITTTWVSGMVGWSIIRMPSGKQRAVDGVGVVLQRGPSASSHPTSDSLFWNGSFLLFRMMGLLGLSLIVCSQQKSLADDCLQHKAHNMFTSNLSVSSNPVTYRNYSTRNWRLDGHWYKQ